MRSFSLKPFPTAGPSPHFKITGAVGRRFNKLSIRYELSQDPAELIFPTPSTAPMRKSGLWEETCFEFFLAPRDAAHYWEFNLSPAGHWNVYHFTSYREGMKEEPAIASLPFSVRFHSRALQVSVKLDLEDIVPAEQLLYVALGAVTKTANGEMTYWALLHSGPKADFHRRDNFIIEL